ncbi:oxidoreductase [Paenibacillus sp. R14(2021)]|uniref:oxidoreductase n=1 Tax=Paenibacillus sp. R14(2021) TaxID=2859228 RepID=UPI001C61269A|nr:oxidoreductase [Paenibacillus sp. R14(2021)]
MKQKVWFITGTARGFGMEIVKAVLAFGDRVFATVRGNPEVLVSKLGSPEGLYVAHVDITNDLQVKEAAKQAIDQFGVIDVLVNNAGYGLLSAVEEATDEEVRENFDTNVFGLLNVTRAVLPYMRKQGFGHIINISSLGGLTGLAGWGIYGATKFAVVGLTESLALELAPLGIHATVVAPGFFRTDFLDSSSLNRSGRVIYDYESTVGEVRGMAAQLNQHQRGNPTKLAEAILKIAAADKPPVHLPLGKDTIAKFREKTANFEREIDEWHDVITMTDYEDA